MSECAVEGCENEAKHFPEKTELGVSKISDAGNCLITSIVGRVIKHHKVQPGDKLIMYTDGSYKFVKTVDSRMRKIDIE